MSRYIVDLLEEAKTLAIEADKELAIIHQSILGNPRGREICEERMPIVREKHQRIREITRRVDFMLQTIRTSLNNNILE